MACSHGAASPACTPSNSQQPVSGEKVTKHGATSPSAIPGVPHGSARPSDQVQGHKEGHGRASGHYPSPGKSSHPPPVPPSSLAHLMLGLLAPAPCDPFAKGWRTCTTPYLSHEVLLKRLLLEGLCSQAVCKGEQGSAWAGLARSPTLASPSPACGVRGLQGNSSSSLIPEPAGEASKPLGLGTHHPISRRCKDHREVGE